MLKKGIRFLSQSEKLQSTPGRNVYVKELYQMSQQAFITWRKASSPRDGPIAYVMSSSRAAYKTFLRECKMNKETLRPEPLVHNLRNRSKVLLWKGTKLSTGSKRCMPISIYDITGERNVTEIWKNKFDGFFLVFETYVI